jgi:hypothetical protein
MGRAVHRHVTWFGDTSVERVRMANVRGCGLRRDRPPEFGDGKDARALATDTLALDQEQFSAGLCHRRRA